MEKKIPVEISARHIHLSQEDLERIFGKGYELKKMKQLTQPSDFAAKETLDIKVGEKILKNVRIVGPVREKTQVELSTTDSIFLGIKVPFRLSGNIEGTPGAVLIGPQGEIEIKEGLIIPIRHLHANFVEAKELGIKDGEEVSIKIEGERALVFHKVKVRVKENYALCVHLDTDEGNAAGIDKKTEGILITEKQF